MSMGLWSPSGQCASRWPREGANWASRARCSWRGSTGQGAEAELDRGEAEVVLAGRPTKVYLLFMCACHSGAAFCMAAWRRSQRAFLGGHVAALSSFGGVFEVIRYDNLRPAVKLVLLGRRIHGAHEKGGVEGEVGSFRRNHLVPIPEVADLADLNAMLLPAAPLADLDARLA